MRVRGVLEWAADWADGWDAGGYDDQFIGGAGISVGKGGEGVVGVSGVDGATAFDDGRRPARDDGGAADRGCGGDWRFCGEGAGGAGAEQAADDCADGDLCATVGAGAAGVAALSAAQGRVLDVCVSAVVDGVGIAGSIAVSVVAGCAGSDGLLRAVISFDRGYCAVVSAAVFAGAGSISAAGEVDEDSGVDYVVFRDCRWADFLSAAPGGTCGAVPVGGCGSNGRVLDAGGAAVSADWVGVSEEDESGAEVCGGSGVSGGHLLCGAPYGGAGASGLRICSLASG